MALPERFWQWSTSGLLAGLLAMLSIFWQASRHEHDALAQVTDWTNKAQDGRLTRLEERQEDVRSRLASLESKYLYEILPILTDIRKRLERVEQRLYRLPTVEEGQ